MKNYTERREYVYDKSNMDSGNCLIVTRVYWFYFIPYRLKVRKFNTDNAIWINNDIFGRSNDHNINKAFEL